MKWYKKQMDALKEKEAKIASAKAGKGAVSKTSLGHSFDLRKTGSHKATFPNPVAISKKNRPKTDVH